MKRIHRLTMMIIGFSYILISNSCFIFNREKCADNVVVTKAKFSTLFTKYFGNIKPNNFWIFKRNSDNIRDSFFVSTFKEERVVSCPEGIEGLDLKLTLSPDTMLSKLKINMKIGTSSSKNNIDITSVNTKGQVGGKGLYFSRDEVETKILPVLDSIIILNQTFKDVLFIKQDDGGELMFAPNVGLIRFVLTNPKDTFNLEKFKIQ